MSQSWTNCFGVCLQSGQHLPQDHSATADEIKLAIQLHFDRGLSEVVLDRKGSSYLHS